MLACLEAGARFTLEFGDIDEPFYNSLCSVLAEVARILEGAQGPDLYGQCRPRLPDLADQAGDLAGALRRRGGGQVSGAGWEAFRLKMGTWGYGRIAA